MRLFRTGVVIPTVVLGLTNLHHGASIPMNCLVHPGLVHPVLELIEMFFETVLVLEIGFGEKVFFELCRPDRVHHSQSE